MSTPRKVLVIPSWYPSDHSPTAGIFIQQQVRALADLADVAVLHVDTGQAAFGPLLSVEEGVTVVRAGVPASGLFDRFFGYRKAGLAAFEMLRAAWGDPEIVHVQALFPAAMIARDVKRRLGTPYVVTEHSEEYLASSNRRLVRTPGALPLLLRPLARSASRTVAVSKFLEDRLVELGLAVNPVVIPNIVPIAAASPGPVAAPHAIAHVSIMSPAKNTGVLLLAIDRLRTRRTDFALRLVGDGECQADSERIAKELSLGGLVEFTGRKSVDEVRAILASSAFSVVSSIHETFSVAAAESLMCGRPVLSTRCGGPEEFITPEVGRLIEPDDVDALAEGLDWMLDHYSEFDPQALHEYARARFAPDVVARRILGIYSEVLDG
jgi:glycosyltransferase involved in cell wall biosynthesis